MKLIISNFKNIKIIYNDRLIIIKFIYISIIKLILEVFGAGGAIWGFSDILNLRNQTNIFIWRIICLIITFIFLIIFIFNRINDYKNKKKCLLIY